MRLVHHSALPILQCVVERVPENNNVDQCHFVHLVGLLWGPLAVYTTVRAHHVSEQDGGLLVHLGHDVCLEDGVLRTPLGGTNSQRPQLGPYTTRTYVSGASQWVKGTLPRFASRRVTGHAGKHCNVGTVHDLPRDALQGLHAELV